MDEKLIEGKYLGREICACSGNARTMWLIVFDGKYNYMLFEGTRDNILHQYSKGGMPYNNIGGKRVEYYSNFDNALRNLVKVVANNGFLV